MSTSRLRCQVAKIQAVLCSQLGAAVYLMLSRECQTNLSYSTSSTITIAKQLPKMSDDHCRVNMLSQMEFMLGLLVNNASFARGMFRSLLPSV
jgi:hypothetical protein